MAQRFARKRGYVRTRTSSRPYVGTSVGALERGDPIPPGVYWIDSIDPEAFGDEAEAVEAAREGYMLVMQGPVYRDAFRIVRSTRHEQDAFNQYGRDWILFQVMAPIPRWPLAAKWGFPGIAPKGVHTQEGDTATNRPTEGPLDELGETTFGVPTWAWALGGLAALGVVVYAASR